MESGVRQRLDLILDPMATPGVLAAKAWIRRGSGADPQGQRGAHQLLGSLLSRGCGPNGSMELADLVEGCGAGLRCDTNEDGLLISLKCRDRDAEQLVPLIGWMLRQPLLQPDQVDLEKELSLQALQRQKEDPFHLAYDGWRSLAYGSGPYGHDPLGVAGDLQQLGPEALRPLAHQLESEGSVLALSGTIPESLLSLLKEHEAFLSFPDGSMAIPATSHAPAAENGHANPSVTLCLKEQKTEQVVLMLGQPSLPHGHPDDPALRLLQAHLSHGMSSLLFRRLREEHGVAYDVGAYLPARRDAAPFVLHASSSADRAELALTLLLDSWDELSDRDLTSDELELARAKYRGQVAHASQTASQRAERSAQLQGLGLPDDHDQQCLNKLEALTPTDLRQAARRWLNQPELSLCGPGSILKRLESLWQRRQSATGSS